MFPITSEKILRFYAKYQILVRQHKGAFGIGKVIGKAQEFKAYGWSQR